MRGRVSGPRSCSARCSFRSWAVWAPLLRAPRGPARRGGHGLLPGARLVPRPLLVGDGLPAAAVGRGRAYARGRRAGPRAHGGGCRRVVGPHDADARARALPGADRRALDASAARRGRPAALASAAPAAGLAPAGRSCSRPCSRSPPGRSATRSSSAPSSPSPRWAGSTCGRATRRSRTCRSTRCWRSKGGPVAQDRYCRADGVGDDRGAPAGVDLREARRADAGVLEGGQRGARSPGGPRRLRPARPATARADRARPGPAVPRARSRSSSSASRAALLGRRRGCCCCSRRPTTPPTSSRMRPLASACP